MLKVIINTKRYSLVQTSLFFQKTKFKHLKSIYFYSKTPSKQMLAFFNKAGEKINLAKILASEESFIFYAINTRVTFCFLPGNNHFFKENILLLVLEI